MRRPNFSMALIWIVTFCITVVAGLIFVVLTQALDATTDWKPIAFILGILAGLAAIYTRPRTHVREDDDDFFFHNVLVKSPPDKPKQNSVHRPWGLILLTAFSGLAALLPLGPVQSQENVNVYVCRVTQMVAWPRYQVHGLFSVPDGNFGYVASGGNFAEDVLVLDGLSDIEADTWQVYNASGERQLIGGEVLVQWWLDDGSIGEVIGDADTLYCSVEYDPSGENPPVVVDPPQYGNGGLGEVVVPVDNPNGCYLWSLNGYNVATVRADPYKGTVSLTRDGSGTYLNPSDYVVTEVNC